MKQLIRYSRTTTCCLVFAGLLGCESSGCSGPKAESNAADHNQAKNDDRSRSLFLAYVKDKHPGEEWKRGPERIDSLELQRSYPGSRFYFVSSPHPMPQGAHAPPTTPPGIGRKEAPKPLLSLCVRFGPGDRVEELDKPDDYNRGLAAIQSDDDVRFAAAAILSTMDGYYFGPSPISNTLIQVQKTPDGWTCRLKTQTKEGRVVFTNTGKCVSISMRYPGPFPG